MKVAFLTEGGTSYGGGHLVRCHALSEAFVERGIECTIYVQGDSTLVADVERKDWREDTQFLSTIGAAYDIVVMDSYHATAAMYALVKMQGTRLVVFDDLHRLDYGADYIINASPAARYDEKGFYGPSYATLRKEFWDVPQKEISEMQRILVTIGNIDPDGRLKEIMSQLPAVKTDVVVGPDFPFVPKGEHISVHTKLSAGEMRKLMADADICVSACGQTLYELARCGVPTIGVGLFDNQKDLVKGFLEAGFITFAGWYTDFTVADAVREMTPAKRRKASQIGQHLVDGQGCRRIVDGLLQG
ncbi:hypothetical protein H6504_01605 [Candidatus Woesearchaeota archaeon]|nr:hypothetical protein [Candidatus Woesearchaeota archaeon]